MKLKKAELRQIQDLLPRRRCSSEISVQTFLNALFYLIDKGCTWRRLPQRYGNWATIYKRYRRWSENGTLDRIEEALHELGVDVDFSTLSKRAEDKL